MCFLASTPPPYAKAPAKQEKIDADTLPKAKNFGIKLAAMQPKVEEAPKEKNFGLNFEKLKSLRKFTLNGTEVTKSVAEAAALATEAILSALSGAAPAPLPTTGPAKTVTFGFADLTAVKQAELRAVVGHHAVADLGSEHRGPGEASGYRQHGSSAEGLRGTGRAHRTRAELQVARAARRRAWLGTGGE